MNATALLRTAASCLVVGLIAVLTLSIAGSGPRRTPTKPSVRTTPTRPRAVTPRSREPVTALDRIAYPSGTEATAETASEFEQDGRWEQRRPSHRDRARTAEVGSRNTGSFERQQFEPPRVMPTTVAPLYIGTTPQSRQVTFVPLPVPAVAAPMPVPQQTATAAIDASRSRPPSEDFSRLSVQLAGLEREVQRLAQARDDKQSEDLLRATEALQQLQRTQQLQSLQDQLRLLQSGTLAPTTQPTPIGAPAAAEPEPVPTRDPILKAEPAGDDETFSLQIEDADVREVLELLGQLSSLNVLVGTGVTGIVSANLNDVTIDEALDALLKSRGFVHERDEKFLYVMTAAEREERERRDRKLVTKVYRPNYISVADLQALVSPLLSDGVGRIAVTTPNETGIKVDSENAGGDQLVQGDALLVHDYSNVIEEVDRIVLEMDVPPPQVVIEAMILSVSLDDNLRFGVNFALLSGDNGELFVSGNGQTLNAASGIPGGDDDAITATGRFIANAAGLKYGWLRGDSSGFVEALETIADTNIVASPQLRVLNKQRAELIIGQRLSYTTTTFNGTQSIETVNFLDVGTKLVIRPFVADDGLVRMEIHPERSSATINATTSLPDVDTTEVTSNVMVRDGATIVIGGLIEESVSESRARIPFLGALPWIGKAFSNVDQATDRNELIILITPRIVREPEDTLAGEAARFENERRIRHFDESLSPVNRRNLTRMHVRRARQFFDRGEVLRARFHVSEALRLSKNDLHALRLKDEIDSAFPSVLPWHREGVEVTPMPLDDPGLLAPAPRGALSVSPGMRPTWSTEAGPVVTNPRPAPAPRPTRAD